MRRQRNMAQMKEANSRKRAKQNGESKLLDAEFKPLVIRMLSELSENFNGIKKGMETIKKN